jgi:hypothetical protein
MQSETSTLVRQEINLATVELSEKAKAAGAGAAQFGVAAVFLNERVESVKGTIADALGNVKTAVAGASDSVKTSVAGASKTDVVARTRAKVNVAVNKVNGEVARQQRQRLIFEAYAVAAYGARRRGNGEPAVTANRP